MADLLSAADLPKGFDYPKEFVRVVEMGLTDLEPWWIMQGPELVERLIGVRRRYPGRTLVPFARRGDRDDEACWDIEAGPGRVAVIEDFEPAGYEQHETHDDFNAWFRSAIEDFIEFED